MKPPNLRPIQPGSIVLVSGPSGSGKTTLLPALIDQTQRPSCIADPAPDEDLPLIDELPLPSEAAAAALTACGLTDPVTWSQTPDELSEGQRARWALCKAIYIADGWIVADDWLCTLDQPTAQAVAWTAGRAMRAANRGAILCTPRDDLSPFLFPDIHVRVGWSEEPVITHPPAVPPRCPLLEGAEVERGSLADYRPFAPMHYAAGPPRSPRSVWLIWIPSHPQPVGCAVLTYPDLRNPARDLVTDGVYRSAHGRQVARRLNQEVARIARIVILPEYRGIGLARCLLDHIADHEGVKWLEISTAMAHYTNFLDACGFVEAPRPAHDVEAHLLDWADRHQIDPAVAFDPTALVAELDRMSIRERRLGRRLVWQYYHKHVLHRRTKAPMPKNVPNESDDRWIAAFEFVARRLYERPRYLIRGPLTPDQEPPECPNSTTAETMPS